jgi:hypothetical protein
MIVLCIFPATAPRRVASIGHASVALCRVQCTTGIRLLTANSVSHQCIAGAASYIPSTCCIRSNAPVRHLHKRLLPLHASPVHHYPSMTIITASIMSITLSLRSDPKINASRQRSTFTMFISVAILHAQPMRTTAVSERRFLYLGAVVCFRVGQDCGLHTA